MARVPRMNRLSPFIYNKLGKMFVLERPSAVGLNLTMTSTVGHSNGIKNTPRYKYARLQIVPPAAVWRHKKR